MDLSEIIQTMNDEQRRIFTKFTNVLLNESGEENKLLSFISGEAGTGKSYLIKAFRC